MVISKRERRGRTKGFVDIYLFNVSKFNRNNKSHLVDAFVQSANTLMASIVGCTKPGCVDGLDDPSDDSWPWATNVPLFKCGHQQLCVCVFSVGMPPRQKEMGTNIVYELA